MSENNNVYITRDGLEIKLRAIKPLKIQRLEGSIKSKYLKNGEPIDPPFYYVETAGKGRQRHYYDEKSIATEGVPKKDLEAWDLHMDAVERYSDELNLAAVNLAFTEGVDFELPSDQTWLDEQIEIGFAVPTTPALLKMHYLTTEVLDLDEMRELVDKILAYSMRQVEAVVEEATAVSDNFPNQVQDS